MWYKNMGITFFHFATNQTDGRTDRQLSRIARPRWHSMQQRGKKRTICKKVQRVELSCRSRYCCCCMSMMFTDQFTGSVPTTTRVPAVLPYIRLLLQSRSLITVSCNTAIHAPTRTASKNTGFQYSITSQMFVPVLWSFTIHNEQRHAVNSSSRIIYCSK